MNHKLVCIVSPSGGGKSTLAKGLEKLGLKELKSFSTRKPRYDGEDTHTFITEQEYMRLKNDNQIVASTYFNGNFYGATKDMVLNNDIYVIDIQGLIELKDNLNGECDIIAIYLNTNPLKCISRMKKRGDSTLKSLERWLHDREKFKDARKKCNYLVNGNKEVLEVLVNVVNILIEEGVLEK